ncbi:hypothetical protein [Microbispora triticiradicis]|uniref:AsnC family protein n=2 Tax=Microbispora TaxID=2005 RepID=A0ABY3LQ24_9ACTN|nr:MULTISPECIES: hypothetical protein [Microbispora]TLP66536.1 hypothetical protein FED44_03490 [Microbispora fusca]TYB47429.1 hypothetical protein FXF59_29890 [Microbispora tritici]
MSWQTDDGEHEGWDSTEFPGDRFSVGGQADAVLVRHFPPRPGPLPDRKGEPEIIDRRQAPLGWRGLCECGWRGPLWERADSPGEHDFATRRIWSSDQYAPEDVADAIREEWRAHLEPETLTEVRRQAQEAAAAQDRLARAVRAARADGRSWAEIGAAAGITRQSAHERWTRTTEDARGR